MPNMVKETQVLYNAHGKRTHVILPIKSYEELLARIEDADDIKAIKAVLHEKTIPWCQVKKQLHKNR